jgi:hypothetical protein
MIISGEHFRKVLRICLLLAICFFMAEAEGMAGKAKVVDAEGNTG